MTNVEAVDAFLALKAEVDRLLARLTAAGADHFGVAPSEIHWGHVGSLSRATDLLRDAADALGGAA